MYAFFENNCGTGPPQRYDRPLTFPLATHLLEIVLQGKLCFKRALNLCLILLRQCKADVNDSNMISICQTIL